MAIAVPGSFKAWIDKMPGAQNTLHVTGKVSGATSAELVDAESPGINPKILILDVVAKGSSPASDPAVDVRYEKKRSPDYDSVTIRGAGPDIHVVVEIVH